MSATNRNPLRPRVPHDEYRTPLWAINAMQSCIHWWSIDTMLDPCAGDGRILREALTHRPSLRVESCEIRDGKDYFDQVYHPIPFDLVMTNPPFSIAQDIITKALIDGNAVVMLQRLNFLASQARREWWQQNPPSHLFVLSSRPCFIHVCAGHPRTSNNLSKGCGASYHADDAPTVCTHCGGRVRPGTDATDYAWYAWQRPSVAHCTFIWPPGIYHL